MLGSTLERVTLPDDLVARLEGKSSFGRLGLLIHSTAGFIDPGWDGHVTLELSNVANLPITIYPGMKIGQLSFVQLSEPAERPYGSAGNRLEVPGPARPDAEPLLAELQRRLIRLLLGGSQSPGPRRRDARGVDRASVELGARRSAPPKSSSICATWLAAASRSFPSPSSVRTA